MYLFVGSFVVVCVMVVGVVCGCVVVECWLLYLCVCFSR